MADRAVVTGVSSGIGLELAKVFARKGFDAVMVAERRGRRSQVDARL
jgi:NAD(P)-dependent dehydrogenase (short-subunit alcohol dehydrogenase family)